MRCTYSKKHAADDFDALVAAHGIRGEALPLGQYWHFGEKQVVDEITIRQGGAVANTFHEEDHQITEARR